MPRRTEPPVSPDQLLLFSPTGQVRGLNIRHTSVEAITSLYRDVFEAGITEWINRGPSLWSLMLDGRGR